MPTDTDSTPTDYEITTAMTMFGGSFVRAFGALWPLADDDNRARMKAAWPEYWAQYGELALWKRQRALASGGAA
jgi:hypothetical protein